MEFLPFEDLPDYENLPEELTQKINKFENKNNVNIYYDIGFKELVISQNHKTLGSISAQLAPFDDFMDELHLHFEVHPNYRGKGFGKFLYSLYKDFNKIYPDIFPIPEKEYTQKASTLGFYIKNNIYRIIEKYDGDISQFEKVNEEDLPGILEVSDNDELDFMYRLSK